jgi:hypothetical protein
MASAEPKNIARSWTRLDGIDLLRGLAIFFVLMKESSYPWRAGEA